ncbi:hypothetical protein M9434_003588 [Picochlorum sp. BPE23]|nr:hypothetical protein M9434_003588 [Picochlorum sp. BPE23]
MNIKTIILLSIIVSLAQRANCRGRWKLLWRDEFKRLDKSKWSHMTGDGCEFGICGWGNNEHQYYTKSKRNAYVEAGRLILKARKETGSNLRSLQKFCEKRCGSDRGCKNKCQGVQISSARLRSLNKFSISPGYKGYDAIKITVKVKVMPGEGIWPAIWMLPDSGNNSCSGCGKYGIWAQSGEIDIFEAVNNMEEALGTIHYGGSWPENLSWGSKVSITPKEWSKISLIWRKDSIEWYLNSNLFHRVHSGRGTRNGWFSSSRKAATYSPFDEKFHLLLNVAVGGGLTGNVPMERALSTLESSSKTMHIDYIRVYGLKE